jgi:hypothetical protein
MEVKGYLEEDKKYVEQNNSVGGNMNSEGHMELALRMLKKARKYVFEGILYRQVRSFIRLLRNP